jgi:hypothetical protein
MEQERYLVQYEIWCTRAHTHTPEKVTELSILKQDVFSILYLQVSYLKPEKNL